MALSRHCRQGSTRSSQRTFTRDVGDSCAPPAHREFHLYVKPMRLKTGQAARLLWVQPTSCRASCARFRSSLYVRAHASQNSSAGDDCARSSTHGQSRGSPADQMPLPEVFSNPDAIPGSGINVPRQDKARHAEHSAANPLATDPPYQVTVQVLGNLHRNVVETSAEQSVLDVAYEVVDEPNERPRHQVMQRDSLMSGVEPGDPYEEGWVADTANDARARHWQSEESQYKPVSWSEIGLNFGSFDVVATVGGGGHRGDRTSGGGGDGGGTGYYSRTAYGDGGGGSAAVAIVYAFLVAVLGYFWWSIYIVVSKPELIGKKVSTFWSSQRWRAKVLQRNKEVKIAPRKETRYRTLCVYRQGYSRLARRLIAPSPAVDVSLLDHTLERDGGYSSMFLEVPRPTISAHPVQLRKITGGPRLVNSRARTSMTRDGGAALKLDVPISVTPKGIQMWPAHQPIDTEARRISKEMHMMHAVGDTPFEDGAQSSTFPAVLSLHRASGSLPSSDALDDILHEMRSATCCGPSSSFRHRRLSWAGLSAHGGTAAPGTSSTTFTRRVTFTRFGDVHDPSLNDDFETQLTSHEYHDLQRHFVSHVVPGSLALSTLQRHSAHARHDPSFPFEHAGRGEAASVLKRNKSQPALSVDEPRIPTHEPVRRSASLHSLADAKSAIKAGEGLRSGSEGSS